MASPSKGQYIPPDFDAVRLAAKFTRMVDTEADKAIVNAVRDHLGNERSSASELERECRKIVQSSDMLMDAIGSAANEIERFLRT